MQAAYSAMQFLSCLYGSEPVQQPSQKDSNFLSCLYGSEPSKPTKPTGQRGYITDEQASEIVTWLKNFSGLYKDLAKMVGCSSSLLIHIKTRRSRCTFEVYSEIMKARKELEVAA